MAQTLDTEMKQVLVHYGGDAKGLFYHHRALAVPGPDGKWIGITPDHEVQLIDLVVMAEGLAPLRRSSRLPAHIAPAEIYAFDPFVGNEDQALREECREFAALLGWTRPAQAVGALGSWRVSDTASSLFARIVPEEVWISAS